MQIYSFFEEGQRTELLKASMINQIVLTFIVALGIAHILIRSRALSAA